MIYYLRHFIMILQKNLLLYKIKILTCFTIVIYVLILHFFISQNFIF